MLNLLSTETKFNLTMNRPSRYDSYTNFPKIVSWLEHNAIINKKIFVKLLQMIVCLFGLYECVIDVY